VVVRAAQNLPSARGQGFIALSQQIDQRQRQFPLLQIGAQRFAGSLLLTHQIEQVVGNLERQPHTAAIASQRLHDFRGRTAVQRSQVAAAGGQFRRFAIDNVEIVRLAQIEIAALKHLTQFALADTIGRRADEPAGADIVEGTGEVKGMGKQVIAEQNAGLHPPNRVDRCHTPAHLGAVEYIVVNECGRVDHLDHGTQDVMGRSDPAASASRQQQQHRPQPFAAIVMDVLDDLGDTRMFVLQNAGQDALDFFQVRRDGTVRVQSWNDQGRYGQRDRIHGTSTTKAVQMGAIASARGFRNFNSR